MPLNRLFQVYRKNERFRKLNNGLPQGLVLANVCTVSMLAILFPNANAEQLKPNFNPVYLRARLTVYKGDLTKLAGKVRKRNKNIQKLAGTGDSFIL